MNTETLINKLEEIESLALDIKGRFTATVIAVKTKDLIRELSPPANHCHCGAELPTVDEDETPYEFCSEKCKDYTRILKGIETAEIHQARVAKRLQKRAEEQSN